MRDGVALALDVLLPEGQLRPYPVILIRTCYDKTRHMSSLVPVLDKLLDRGYVIASQDVRGRFNSGGEAWGMYFHEFDDGADTLAWIAQQPWCDGNIGMYGGSYEGTTQLAAAWSGSPHLKAIVPIAATPNSMWGNEPIRGGAFLAPMVQYAIDMGQRSFQLADFAQNVWAEDRASSMTLPFSDIPTAEGAHSKWIAEMLEHPTLDDFWRRGEFGNWDQFDVPAFHITGWWDMNLPGALDNFPSMQRAAASVSARDGQRMLIGPWPHWINRQRVINGWDMGAEAIIDLDSMIIDFFDQHLRDLAPRVLNDLPVQVFVLGANEWWSLPEWPIKQAQTLDLHLSSGGGANTLLGDGRLSISTPHEPGTDLYTYDPLDPVHAFHEMCTDGPVDDRVPSTRQDVLCYSTEALSEALYAVGPVKLTLWAASSAPDTDWHARLVDVHPDGSARYLCHGVLRARFRDSFSHPVLLEPDKPYEFRIPMDSIAIRFDPGHQVRLEVTSSWSPRYDRNTNTGSDNPFHESQTIPAHQTIYHGPTRPSRLALQVVAVHPTLGAS